MDPNLQRIAANIGKMIDGGAPDGEIDAYLRDEGFESRDAWLGALQPPKPVNTGPTPQPPFATLPPMVGGALDLLVAFGAGIPGVELAGDTRQYMEGLRGRNPKTTAAVESVAPSLAAFAATPALMGSGLLGNTAARAVSPSGLAVTGRHLGSYAAQGARAAGRGAMAVGRAVKPVLPWAIGGGVLARYMTGRP